MSDILVSRDGSVLQIELNRPAKKNAVTLAMYEALIGALKEADADPSVRVVLLCAAGSAFCAGNDLGDFLAASGLVTDSPPIRFIEALVTFPKPIVAAVGGAAVGIGATMLLHCELVYASEAARLSMPFVSLGLVPEAASSLLLPERVGHLIASEMLLLGTPVEARRAVELRLVNEVVTPASELLTFARGKARELAQRPPRAVRTTKALLRSRQAAVLSCVKEEEHHFAASLISPEAREALTAFLERRPPDFSQFS
jgi:enoyl-CoA hydratase/carnithine racemase